MGVVGWLVVALGVAGERGLVELVGGAAGWDVDETCVCGLAGAASAREVWVGGEEGGGLGCGWVVAEWIGWSWGVVWVVRVVDGSCGWCGKGRLGAADFGFGLWLWF